MDWKEKMDLGMKTIQEACKENEDWTKCKDCPFNEYCTTLMDAKLIDPFEGITFFTKEEP